MKEDAKYNEYVLGRIFFNIIIICLTIYSFIENGFDTMTVIGLVVTLTLTMKNITALTDTDNSKKSHKEWMDFD